MKKAWIRSTAVALLFLSLTSFVFGAWKWQGPCTVTGTLTVTTSVTTPSLILGSTAITATGTELNYLHNATDVRGVATASKVPILDANKSLSEIHTPALYLGAAGGTLITATAAEINALGPFSTPGTVEASAAAVCDANKDLSTYRNLTATNLLAGASGTAGTLTVYPATAANGTFGLLAANNASNKFLKLTNAAVGQDTTVTVPDPGAGTASVVLTAGDQTVGGAKTFSSRVKTSYGVGTAGTGTTVVEYGTGAYHQSVLTSTLSGANKITLADGAHGGGAALYTFPEGVILILGVVVDSTVTNTAGFNASTNDTFSFALGTATAADDDDLTSTEADIIAKITIDTDSGGTTTRAEKAHFKVPTGFDGSSAAKALYCNFAIAAAMNTDAVDLTFAGTTTVTWMALGDY